MRPITSIILFSLFYLQCSMGLCGSVPPVSWSTTIGGSGEDEAISVKQTPDGGYILAGITESYGAGTDDLYLVKVNGSGVFQWSTTYGGAGIEYGQSLDLTQDGGFIITGGTHTYGMGSGDVYLVKTNSLGALQWSTTFGGVDIDYGHYVLQTQDGGYVIAGYTDSFSPGLYDYDVYLIKTNSLGTLQWSTTIGSIRTDRGFSITTAQDGGYVIVGESNSFGVGFTDLDMYMVKTNSQGVFQWSKTFGGSGIDRAYSVSLTSDGGYIIAGEMNMGGSGNYDMYLVKTDSLGTLQWSANIGGNNNDHSYSVQQALDGGYIITGWTQSTVVGSSDIYLVKTDGMGTLEWSTTFGGVNDDYGLSVQQTSDKGYIITGSTNSFGAGLGDIYLIKLAGPPTCAELWKDPKD